MKSGPIIAVEDDADDEEILNEILKELAIPNKLIWFRRCDEALQYLLTTTDQPFVILCDVNLPGLSGIEFKRQIDSNPHLRKKSIPFVFYSTSAHQDAVKYASIQIRCKQVDSELSIVSGPRKLGPTGAVRKLSSTQHPGSSIQPPASRIQHPAARLQPPASRLQPPASLLQPSFPTPTSEKSASQVPRSVCHAYHRAFRDKKYAHFHRSLFPSIP